MSKDLKKLLFGDLAAKWKTLFGGLPNYCCGNHYEWFYSGIVGRNIGYVSYIDSTYSPRDIAPLWIQMTVTFIVTTRQYSYEGIICRLGYDKNGKRTHSECSMFSGRMRRTSHCMDMSTSRIFVHGRCFICVNIGRSPCIQPNWQPGVDSLHLSLSDHCTLKSSVWYWAEKRSY